MRIHATLTAALALGLALTAAPDAGARSLETLHERIAALQAPDVAWRRIAWKSCLLDGLLEARRTKKPLLLWVFIDRPVDDARC